MDYIVMDLEWNQCPYGKGNEAKGLPFEIIEIGAVKLNEDFEIIDKFSEIIKPRIYKQLHYKVKDITHITLDELYEGRSFRSVIYDFLEWCGDDYRFVTWGTMDLRELQRNMKFYHLERVLDFPLFFYDLQKMYSLCYENGRTKRTLSYAVEELKIDMDIPFHRAIDDSIYTARVMKTMDFKKVQGFFSVDTFYLPRIKEEEIFIRFENYTKYVSREFFDKEEMFRDKELTTMNCNICDKPLERRINWFSDGMKTHYCVGYCKEHGLVRGKLRIKSAEEDMCYAIKILKSTDEEGAQKIADKQKAIREKRRERRIREKMEMREEKEKGSSYEEEIEEIEELDD
ncbi:MULTISPECIES: 3'-5' exonuclease [Eubacterium]|uniref:Inhibitor of the KinA pathway to sporulation, predicted exonuclease n=1 Tax=Eubacterium uniforme TaxID=39495 RepID=A0A1T4VEG2_9FIRM|nr:MULTISPECIES: 3'-5' exonuclease [Eubacterium]MCR5630117.1 exonuclease domain-containing protein [Eubacterium sp.]SKA63364.1 Inhibitor of the KinA pathway to sporulation, predicted exonuclease [Eubacterium uniforme]HAH18666.1 DNA polymerase III [Eubacterium sp.]HAV90560.1 DNA polymerase III [Eubacterium sp.]